MGRMIYWMNVSMDLCIEHAPNEQGGGTWMRVGEVLHREFNERARRLALFVEGRVIYETMEAFWPKARDDDTLPDFMREYGRIWTDAPKVLLSNTRRAAEHNTRIVGGNDALEQLARLRRETDGEIGVGGATVATNLLRHGLLDELLLFVHPVVLGSGRPLFDHGAGVVACDLIEHATFPEGVVMHRYAIRH
jgi:dihydrofolate reductase